LLEIIYKFIIFSVALA